MTLDVSARLAEGRGSATNTQIYVSACHALGYQYPDLTAHGAQILEWYGGEDGLDLHVLGADCAALRAASAAADEAVRVTRDGMTALAVEWHGESGSAAVDFIERQGANGIAVAGALRAAADICEVLRDCLWRRVDEKAAAAVSIDDRRAGERPAWLAAAGALTSGGAAQTDADEVVTRQITPYVDTDIRTEWLSAMRSATASVSAAYEDAVRQLNACPVPYFDVPDAWSVPLAVAPTTSPQAAVHTAPAAAPMLETPGADPTPAVPAPAPELTGAEALPPQPPTPTSPPPSAEPPPQPGLPAPAGMPTAPDIGGGLSGLVSQIADALGGLFDGTPDAPADDPSQLEDPVGNDEHQPADDDQQSDTGTQDDVVPDDDSAPTSSTDGEIPVADEPPEADPETVEAAPANDSPAPQQPPPPPPPPSAEHPDEQTPCEIAADELPQVGQ